MSIPDTSSNVETGLAALRRRYHRLTVCDVVRETAEATTLLFDVPAALHEVFRYQAGQFLTFEIPYDGTTLRRCYSLASSPLCDTRPRVTVKRVAGGRVSNWINDRVRPGSSLSVLPPAGRFVLGDEADDLFFFSGGSGITPVISLIKTALEATSRRIRLVYANRDEASIIFRAELGKLEAAHPRRLEVVHRLDAVHGLLDARAVRDYVGEPGSRIFYLCGPEVFMDVAESTLAAMGVPPDRLHAERFSAPPEEAEAREPGETVEEGRTVKVGLDGDTRRVSCREGETVLQASRRAGLQPPSSCESGMCGCCMARLTHGRVAMRNNEFLESDEVAEGWVLTCQSVPETDDCHIEYPD